MNSTKNAGNLRIQAALMRGGSSKGLFFDASALPSNVVERDRILLRAMGSPDRYGKQIDGLGGATSSTSKVVLLSKSTRAGCDVDYLFGQVDIEQPRIDYSGNCGNLTAAVGPFAIEEGMVTVTEPITTVRIWQQNIGKMIVAHVPVVDGKPATTGDFVMAGVDFPGAKIYIEYMDPAGEQLFPTGNLIDLLQVPGHPQPIKATLLNAGSPMVLINAAELGLSGVETQADINGDATLLTLCESIRAHGAVRMGLGETPETVTASRPGTPKLAFVSSPRNYRSSAGEEILGDHYDISARTLSMGRLHHAIPGTVSIAIAVAASLPGTVASAFRSSENRSSIRAH